MTNDNNVEHQTAMYIRSVQINKNKNSVSAYQYEPPVVLCVNIELF